MRGFTFLSASRVPATRQAACESDSHREASHRPPAMTGPTIRPSLLAAAEPPHPQSDAEGGVVVQRGRRRSRLSRLPPKALANRERLLDKRARKADEERQRQERMEAGRIAREQAATKIQAAYRGRLGREHARLSRTVLGATNRVSGNFELPTTREADDTNPEFADAIRFRRKEPNPVLQQTNPRKARLDALTSYVKYDSKGYPIRRVDLTGATHGGVPTPHVLDYTPHRRERPHDVPLVQYGTPRKNAVRPPRSWEIPFGWTKDDDVE